MSIDDGIPEQFRMWRILPEVREAFREHLQTEAKRVGDDVSYDDARDGYLWSAWKRIERLKR